MTDQLFKHSREGNKLTAKVLVEDLLRKDHDIFVISRQIFEEENNHGNPWILEESVEWAFRELKQIDEQYPDGFHCVGWCDSCSRCSQEEFYLRATQLIHDWQKVVPNGTIIDLLAVRLSTDHYFNLACETLHIDRKKGKELFNIYESIEKRYNIWNSLTNDEKEKYLIKATKFRKLFDLY